MKNSQNSITELPWYSADKNLPASAVDTGSVPNPGRSHVLQSN